MSNRFDAGAMKTPSGWIGFYRQVHRSTNFVLRDGKRDVIFATQAEAKEAAWKAFLDYLNSPISGLIISTEAAADSADSLFPNLKPIYRKGRKIEVTRSAANLLQKGSACTRNHTAKEL
jgi:hypothetical protein